MLEPILKESIAQKIEKHCERLHNDLGNPEPPVSLDAIRELLRLDKTFYSLEDPSFLNHFLHKLMIAGKQVLTQPTRLLTALQKWDIKALWIPEKRRILLDDSIAKLKKRWTETHEIGHSIIPWHEEYLHGDPETSLSVSCRVIIEAEANYAAGQILFPKKFFRESLPEINAVNLKTIMKLSKSFGNTVASTLWRVVETLDVPCFGFISEDPRLALPPSISQNEQPPKQTRHFFCSRPFAERFSRVSEKSVWKFLSKNCTSAKWNLLDANVDVPEDNGQKLPFHMEPVNQTHYVATFAICCS
jgi:Zn-dependent peptidase ImmA (M78 family)